MKIFIQSLLQKLKKICGLKSEMSDIGIKLILPNWREDLFISLLEYKNY